MVTTHNPLTQVVANQMHISHFCQGASTKMLNTNLIGYSLTVLYFRIIRRGAIESIIAILKQTQLLDYAGNRCVVEKGALFLSMVTVTVHQSIISKSFTVNIIFLISSNCFDS